MVSFSLTIVRHGETAANATSMIQGQIDEPLNDKGRMQARLLGQSFAKQARPAFTHAISSDLRRAKETAEIVLAHHVGPVHCLMETDKRVRERSYGVLEGKPVTLLRSKAKYANMKTLDYVCPGGESLPQLFARAVDFFEDLCRRLEREEIAGREQRMRHSSSGRRFVRQTSTNLTVWPEEDCAPESAFDQQDEDPHFYMDTPPLSTEPSLTVLAPAGSMDSGLPPDPDDIEIRGSMESSESTKPWWILAQLAQRKESTRSLGACSDDSFFPDVDSHVLLVAHGGWIRELLRHLCDLNSLMHRPAAMRGAPNTGVSRFMVTLDGGVSVTCLELHNKDHLVDLS